MKAVIAIDSFKGSLSSAEAGDAASRAIRSVFTEADIVQFPLADGGEEIEAVLPYMVRFRQVFSYHGVV